MSLLAARYVVAKAGSLVESRMRREPPLSRDRLALLADVAPRTVFRAEHGERIWIQSAIAIARVLGDDVDNLFEVAA